MPERPSYKQTLFDRYGPDAGLRMKAFSYGMIAGGVSLVVFMLLAFKYDLKPLPAVALVVLGPIAVSFVVTAGGIKMMDETEKGVHMILAGGNSTPYTQQNSWQQTLVMQGRLDEALESYEAIIVEEGSGVDVRIRAAELYTREAGKHQRAAELFREACRNPAATPGEESYSANRLADLYAGPLALPGRALVELRRLADRYPDSVIGERAREAIRSMKSRNAELNSSDPAIEA